MLNWFGFSLRKALDKYYTHLRLNCSQETLDVYAYILEQLCHILGASRNVRKIDSAELGQAVLAMYRPDLSDATREKYKRTIRRFFTWLVEREYLKRSPVDFGVNNAKPDVVAGDRAISDEEIDRMLAAATVTRDYALVKVLADTGFRLGGMRNLRVAHIRPDHMTIATVEDKDREKALHEVAMAEETYAALRAWLAEREALVASLPKDHGYVWVNMKNGEWLSKWGIHEILKRLGRRSGVKNYSAHKFRHRWGEWAAENDVAVTKVRVQLGHSSSKTTMEYYYKPSPEGLRDIAKRRARSNGKRDPDADGAMVPA